MHNSHAILEAKLPLNNISPAHMNKKDLSDVLFDCLVISETQELLKMWMIEMGISFLTRGFLILNTQKFDILDILKSPKGKSIEI